MILGSGFIQITLIKKVNYLQDKQQLAIKDLDIYQVSPNKSQPRTHFDKETIEELAESIDEHGIIQPIVVRKKDDYYEIIAGERRWRAAKELGFRNIPSIIKDKDDFEVAQLALVENIQRENLNPVEQARAFRSLMENYNLTQDNIAKTIGKSRSYVANITRLLNLDGKVKDLIVANKLTSGHGRTILGLNKANKQVDLADTIIDQNLSVRQTEKLVKKINQEGIEKQKQPQTNSGIIREIEQSLRSNLGTKVKIKQGKEKGKIEIEYYSEQELERIINLINN